MVLLDVIFEVNFLGFESLDLFFRGFALRIWRYHDEKYGSLFSKDIDI